MKTFACLALAGLSLLAPALMAETLPSVKLVRVFPQLTDERPVWMSEAPDGSGRMFIVYQDGKILIAKAREIDVDRLADVDAPMKAFLA